MLMPEFHLRQARPEDRSALARIIIDATHSAFRGRVPNQCLNWLSAEESAVNWGRTIEDISHSCGEYLYVAELASREVVGLVLAGRNSSESTKDRSLTEKYPTELTSLQIDPAWHRKGLGRKLVRKVAKLLLDKGSSNLLVRVLIDNPNLPFYRQLGAEQVAMQDFDWEGYMTREVILVWEDLQALARGHESN
jgi:GNAT superfamily N-acetyltransferase